MNDFAHIIKEFHCALPIIKNWIDELLNKTEKEAIQVSSLNFSKIHQIFPRTFLENARVVIVPGNPPRPPLTNIGLYELADFESTHLYGVTYKNTFFIRDGHQTESLHFHELVHVAQWNRLGVDNFLLAYGIGLKQFEYRNSPLEQMAYSLQEKFDFNGRLPDVIDLINHQTDVIWNQIKPYIQ